MVLSLSPHVLAETNQNPEILCTTQASHEFSIKAALGAQLPTRGNAFSNSGSAESTMLAPGEEPLINTTAYTNYGSLSREGSATGWGEAILRPAHSAVSYGIGYGISTSKSVLTTRQDTRKTTESELLTNNYNFQGTGYFYPLSRDKRLQPFALEGVTARHAVTRVGNSFYEDNYSVDELSYSETGSLSSFRSNWDFIPVIGGGIELEVTDNVFLGSEARYELSGTSTAQDLAVVGTVRYAFGQRSRSASEKAQNCDVLMVQKEKLERLKEILSRTSLDQIEKALEQASESLPSAP